jgi:hypothetical protein
VLYYRYSKESNLTPTEFEYIKRAVQQLEQPLELKDRIKIERTMAQILSRSAEKLEEDLVDSLVV